MLHAKASCTQAETAGSGGTNCLNQYWTDPKVVDDRTPKCSASSTYLGVEGEEELVSWDWESTPAALPGVTLGCQELRPQLHTHCDQPETRSHLSACHVFMSEDKVTCRMQTQSWQQLHISRKTVKNRDSHLEGTSSADGEQVQAPMLHCHCIHSGHILAKPQPARPHTRSHTAAAAQVPKQLLDTAPEPYHMRGEQLDRVQQVWAGAPAVGWHPS